MATNRRKSSKSPAPRARSSSRGKKAAANVSETKTPTKAKTKYSGINTAESGYEFGGPIGVTALMLWSHYILLYFW